MLKKNLAEAAKLYCKFCNIPLDDFLHVKVGHAILAITYTEEIEEQEIEELLGDKDL